MRLPMTPRPTKPRFAVKTSRETFECTGFWDANAECRLNSLHASALKHPYLPSYFQKNLFVNRFVAKALEPRRAIHKILQAAIRNSNDSHWKKILDSSLAYETKEALKLSDSSTGEGE